MRTFKKFTLSLLMGALSGGAYAGAIENTGPWPELAILHCQVTVAANDLGANEGEAKFDAPIASGKTHGGDPFEFEFRNHKVSILADGKWLGVSWFHNGQLLAEGVTVIGTPTDEARVLMLYNPADQNESAAVDCHK